MRTMLSLVYAMTSINGKLTRDVAQRRSLQGFTVKCLVEKNFGTNVNPAKQTGETPAYHFPSDAEKNFLAGSRKDEVGRLESFNF